MKRVNSLSRWIQNNEREFECLMERLAREDDIVHFPTLIAFYSFWKSLAMNRQNSYAITWNNPNGKSCGETQPLVIEKDNLALRLAQAFRGQDD